MLVYRTDEKPYEKTSLVITGRNYKIYQYFTEGNEERKPFVYPKHPWRVFTFDMFEDAVNKYLELIKEV